MCEVEKKKFFISTIIDLVVLVLMLTINPVIRAMDENYILYVFIIYMVAVLVLFVTNFSWYLVLFYKLREDGFLMFCAGVRNGVRNILATIVVINEIAFLKISFCVIFSYDICRTFMSLEGLPESIIFTNINLFCVISMFLNIYLSLSMLLSSFIKDKSLTSLIINVLAAAISMIVIKIFGFIESVWIKTALMVVFFILPLMLLKTTVHIMKRGVFIAKEN
ncbi:MAG: hypothetical protein IJA10_12200 [Lachnospiraceae bacterium]|nr:hypothetical protein [Lachnospiraceae bacterium]